jgi:protein-tyrosine phosphatase
MERAVQWDGFYNARDLGGVPLRDGRATEPGRVFRSAALRFVTNQGWQEAWEAGVRTIVDLRNPDEIRPRRAAPVPGSAPFKDIERVSRPPAEMDLVRVPLDDIDDVQLWRTIRAEGLDGTPLYFPLFIARKVDRCANAVRAVASARPGGVLFHCEAGRDRTGLVALLLLLLAGASAAAIASDYEESALALPRLFAAMHVPDEGPLVEEACRAHGTTARQAVLDTLDQLDVEAVLRDGGLSIDEMAAARDRLLA